MEIESGKSASRLFNKDYVNKGDLDLSKEVLWVIVGQRAVELWAVKVGSQKGFCHSAWFEPALPTPGRAAEFFLPLMPRPSAQTKYFLSRTKSDLSKTK